MADEERGLRADARRNEDRILSVAAEAFHSPDADTSMKAIAKQAGVGIGTLYRRFPTREQLIEAVYRSETQRLAASAATLLQGRRPDLAFQKWADRFFDYMLTKEGMADALPAILTSQADLGLDSRDLLRNALATLLGASATALKPDVSADDVMMALGGIALIARHEADRKLATRLTKLMIDGLAAD